MKLIALFGHFYLLILKILKCVVFAFYVHVHTGMYRVLPVSDCDCQISTFYFLKFVCIKDQRSKQSGALTLGPACLAQKEHIRAADDVGANTCTCTNRYIERL